MPQIISEPTFTGYISSTHDALLVFECVRRGIMPKVDRRLRDDERRLIRSGAVFVFDEKESGIKRWTDGLLWSPSRILWNFLVYRQIEKKTIKSGGGGPASSSSAEPSASSSSSQLPLLPIDFAFDPLAQGVGSYPPRFALQQEQQSSQPGSAVDSPSSPYLPELSLSGSGDSNRLRTSSQATSRLQAVGGAGRIRSFSSASDSEAVRDRRKPYPLSDPRTGTNTQQLQQQQSPGSLLSSSANGEHSPLSRGAYRSTSNSSAKEAEIERALVGSLKSSYPFAKDGLCKKTISIQVHGSTQHLISYYKVEDVRSGRLRTPLSLPEISGLDISPMILQKSNFRNPPDIEVLPDGTLRYRGDGSESSRRAGGTGSGSEGTSGSDGLGVQSSFDSPRFRRSPPGLNDLFAQAIPAEVKGQMGIGPWRRGSDTGGGEAVASALGFDPGQHQPSFQPYPVSGVAGHRERGPSDNTGSLPTHSQHSQYGPPASAPGRYNTSTPLTLVTAGIDRLSAVDKLRPSDSYRNIPASVARGNAVQQDGDTGILHQQQAVYLESSPVWSSKVDLSPADEGWTPSGGLTMPGDIAGSAPSQTARRVEGVGWHQAYLSSPNQQQHYSLPAHYGVTPQEGLSALPHLANADSSGDLSYSPIGHFEDTPYQQQHSQMQRQDFPQAASPLVQAMQQQALHDNGGVASFDMGTIRAGAFNRPLDETQNPAARSWQRESAFSQHMAQSLPTNHGHGVYSADSASFGLGQGHHQQQQHRSWQQAATEAANNTISAVGANDERDFGSFAHQARDSPQQSYQSQHQHSVQQGTESWAQEQELYRQRERLRFMQQQHQHQQHYSHAQS